MLIVRDLTAGYERCTVLHGVGFAIEANSITAILGPSGAGKTTLANAVCGLLPVTSGQVVFDGEDITRAPLCERIGYGISYVPAGRTIFAEMSVLDNLQLGAPESPPESVRRELDFVLWLFPDVRLWLGASAGSLPSALQRIVMFARGLMSAPRLLVLDQPGFGLSGEDIQRLFGAISRINHENHTAVLIFEQNVFQALKLADTAWRMEKGRVAGERNGMELLADRALQATFPSHGWQAPGTAYHP